LARGLTLVFHHFSLGGFTFGLSYVASESTNGSVSLIYKMSSQTPPASPPAVTDMPIPLKDMNVDEETKIMADLMGMPAQELAELMAFEFTPFNADTGTNTSMSLEDQNLMKALSHMSEPEIVNLITALSNMSEQEILNLFDSLESEDRGMDDETIAAVFEEPELITTSLNPTTAVTDLPIPLKDENIEEETKIMADLMGMPAQELAGLMSFEFTPFNADTGTNTSMSLEDQNEEEDPIDFDSSTQDVEIGEKVYPVAL
jgi:hypothetical protein